MRNFLLYSYTIVILILIYGCNKSKTMSQMEAIDVLLTEERNEAADSMISLIHLNEISTDEERAYYWLLKTQINYRLYRKIHTVEPLLFTKSYYEKGSEWEKLLRANYYLGCISADLGDRVNAVVYLKQGEIIALKHKSWHMLHHIYEVLTALNLYSKEYSLALQYGRAALKLSTEMYGKDVQAYDLLNLTSIYGEVENIDSELFYVNRMIQCVDSIPYERRNVFYTSIGNCYKKMNPKKAKKALRLSLDTGQNPYAYNALAEIYCQENKMDSAWQMYEKASKTDKLSLRVSILKSMADIRAKQGRYKEANELNAQALALKDSLQAQQRGEDLRGRQEQIEQSASLEELVRENRYWIVVAGLLMAVLMGFSFYYSKRKRRAKQLQLQLLEEIEQKRMELENVRKSEENASDQVDKLTRELKTLEKRYTERIQTGEQLYDELLAGGNTVQWSKHDYDVFIQYSKLKNTKLVKQIEADYAPLSPRYMTCAILHHMGKSDEEIKQALAVSDSSLRSIKTRIKAKKKIVNATSA